MCPAILHFSKIAKMGRIKEEEKNLGNIFWLGGTYNLLHPFRLQTKCLITVHLQTKSLTTPHLWTKYLTTKHLKTNYVPDNCRPSHILSDN